jgi:hypothetical protein
VTQLQERDQGHDGQDRGGGIDPHWNLTYEFTATAARAGKDGAHTLSVYLTVDEYPSSPESRRDLVRRYGPYLVQAWLDRGLPAGDLYHLVHRPGELEPSEGRRIHRADQACARAREHGGVPVVVVLANTPLEPRLVVSRVQSD